MNVLTHEVICKRDSLYGLPAWKVFRGKEHVGWVLRSSSNHNKWAHVPREHDTFAQIEYWHFTRRLALVNLLSEEKTE